MDTGPVVVVPRSTPLLGDLFPGAHHSWERSPRNSVLLRRVRFWEYSPGSSLLLGTLLTLPLAYRMALSFPLPCVGSILRPAWNGGQEQKEEVVSYN